MTHSITDPSAPPGWQCGDPGCAEHGIRTAPRTAADIGAIRERIARLGDRDDIWRVADVVTVAEVAALCDLIEAAAPKSALRRLVAAYDAMDDEAIAFWVQECRVVLAATDVRGALGIALCELTHEHRIREEACADSLEFADAILAALAAKGAVELDSGVEG